MKPCPKEHQIIEATFWELRMEQPSYDLGKEGTKSILVLNLANAVHPGGGVRRGAKAQVEIIKDEKGELLPDTVMVAGKELNFTIDLVEVL